MVRTIVLLDRDANRHDAVVAAMTRLLVARSGITHNYVVIEAEALIHRRYGATPTRRLMRDLVPLLTVVWVAPELHATAVDSHLSDQRKRTSLVDHVSFTVMREQGITDALALDRHFTEAGFNAGP